jgi:hypothetical protein
MEHSVLSFFRIWLLLVGIGADAAGSGAAAGSNVVTVIKADRLITGDGKEISSPVIVVTDDRITAAGPASEIKVPEGGQEH